MIRNYKFYLFLLLGSLLLFRCATEPGSQAPIGGGAVVFTYETGTVRVITNVEGETLLAAAVLFDTDPTTGELAQATEVESGVTVTWPENISFELPDCSTRPVLSDATDYVTFKIFNYAYPVDCTPPTSEDVAGQATVIVSKDGNSRTINDSSSSVTEQTFTSTGTWTAPSGVTSLTVECWGGGGGGAGGGIANGSSGAGGGAYSKKVALAVTPGVSYTVTVGAGGSGGTAGATGTAGGDTWFSTSGTVLAKGGAATPVVGAPGNGTGGSAASGIGDTKYSGGDGTAMTPAGGGVGGGSSAGTLAAGTNGTSIAGAIAPTGGGNGGAGTAVASGLPGSSGSSPGGGGGGGSYSPQTAGGAGGAGQVILDW